MKMTQGDKKSQRDQPFVTYEDPIDDLDDFDQPKNTDMN